MKTLIDGDDIAGALSAGEDVTLSGDWGRIDLRSIDCAGASLAWADDARCNQLSLRDVSNLTIVAPKVTIGDPTALSWQDAWVALYRCATIEIAGAVIVGGRGSGNANGAILEDAQWGTGILIRQCQDIAVRGASIKCVRWGTQVLESDRVVVEDVVTGQPNDPMMGIGDDPHRCAQVNGYVLRRAVAWPSDRSQPEDRWHADFLQHMAGGNYTSSSDILVEYCLAIDPPSGFRKMAGVRIQSMPGYAVTGVTVRRCTLALTAADAIVTNPRTDAPVDIVVEDCALLATGTETDPKLRKITEPQIRTDYNPPELVAATVRKVVQPQIWGTYRAGWDITEASGGLIIPDPADASTWRIDPAHPAYQVGWLDVRDGFGKGLGVQPDPGTVPDPDPEPDADPEPVPAPDVSEGPEPIPAPEPAPELEPDPAPEPATDWQARAEAAEAEVAHLRGVIADASRVMSDGLGALSGV